MCWIGKAERETTVNCDDALKERKNGKHQICPRRRNIIYFTYSEEGLLPCKVENQCGLSVHIQISLYPQASGQKKATKSIEFASRKEGMVSMG